MGSSTGRALPATALGADPTLNATMYAYGKEIDEEYAKLRRKITPKGKFLPYHEYAFARCQYFIEEMAKPSELVTLKATLALRLDALNCKTPTTSNTKTQEDHPPKLTPA